MGIWLLSVFVLSAGYGGSLRAFLTTPTYEDPINDLEGVVKSGMPWDLILYGEEVESQLENSQDPIEQVIWKKKRVIEYGSDSYARVKF